MLEIFGYQNADCIAVNDFLLDKTTVAMGEDLCFSFYILTDEATKVRLEYAVDYVKASGKKEAKIFQISELSLNKTKRNSTAKAFFC